MGRLVITRLSSCPSVSHHGNRPALRDAESDPSLLNQRDLSRSKAIDSPDDER
jgi:hypothetical protein